MAKTYPTIGPFTAGDILTAATMTDVQTNLTNQRVPPMCLLTRSGQPITASTDTVITGYTEDVDTDGMYDAGSPTRITIATAGLYMLNINVAWSGTASTRTDGYIEQNGIGVPAYRDIRYGTNERNHLTIVVACAAADYFEAYVYYTPGSLSTNVRFSATWLGQAS